MAHSCAWVSELFLSTRAAEPIQLTLSKAVRPERPDNTMDGSSARFPSPVSWLCWRVPAV